MKEMYSCKPIILITLKNDDFVENDNDLAAEFELIVISSIFGIQIIKEFGNFSVKKKTLSTAQYL